MIITMVSLVMIMVGYFLILFGAVAFIQNKKFFKSAPKEIYDIIPENRTRFKGAYLIGWIIVVIGVLLFLGAFVLGIIDGITNNLVYGELFLRFLIMLYGMEIYDIFFFDFILLCHSSFYPHYFPECKELVGPHLFGFNWKTHLLHFVIYLPIIALLSLLCVLL